tara:strand:+ start:691 stop:1179 length:489 start_codon:yes stop_codon:yes gene_type:complete
MKHTIRIQLEYKFDVIRDIEIPSEKSLKCLHYAIISSLKLDKNEIASFYLTNEELEILQEIPLFRIDDKDESIIDMSEIKIESVLQEPNSQLIYVYDFLKMWRFLISYTKKTEDKSKHIKVINSIGNMPKEAPEINFESDTEIDSFKSIEDDIHEEFNDSEY